MTLLITAKGDAIRIDLHSTRIMVSINGKQVWIDREDDSDHRL